MEIDKNGLLSAASKIGISEQQAEMLWNGLASTQENAPENKMNISTTLYYVGAMIVISAMGWLMDIGWEKFGGFGMMSIALVYAALFFLIGRALWSKAELRVPAGLFITMAVCMTPLAIYGFQKMMGWVEVDHYQNFFEWIKGKWFLMELGTVITGSVALFYYRFPFLTAPIFFSLWFMSMDIAPLLIGKREDLWTYHLWISLFFGLAAILAAFFVDRKTEKDFSFWGYLFGMMAFWFSLTQLMDTSNEGSRFLYCLLNVGFLLLSVLLQRTVFMVFGALGILIYLTTLTYKYFQDSTLFPFILSLIGVAIVFLGILYRKHQDKIEQWIIDQLPKSAQNLIPKRK